MASKTHVPDPYLLDDDNQPLTDEEIKGLRPAREVFEERGIPFPPTHRRRDGEVQYIVNLDPKVVDYLQSLGGDWQDHLNEKLRDVVAQGEVAKKRAS